MAPGTVTSGLPESFHPLIRSWFAEKYGQATRVQREAWPLIARGEHVLASAPTGSGKTLTAFLDALSRFATGQLPTDGLSVLYISPLKALNEDVRLNLSGPLHELTAYFSKHGEPFPKIKVASRSGDTPSADRRRMISSPPSILCTTPESLAILLASKSGLAALSTVKLLILDEVHAVLGSKRGAALACAVGRLALLAGEFQRVALSATVQPFETAARFVGASRLFHTEEGAASYAPRPVIVVAPQSEKLYQFSVAWPPAPLRVRPPTAGPDIREPDESAGRYDAIVGDLAGRLAHERATIVFADSRRRTERLAAMLNEKSGEGTAWAHHGSLAKDVRKAVENRLKEGRLRCVVATGTLELGIDVGTVDLVAMAGAPARADQALQRAGRSGHGVGLASRAVVYPFHGLDLLAAAAVVDAALESDVDQVRPPRNPLDVLAQTILAMVLFDERRIDDLYDEVRSFSPFTDLARQEFDSVVGMLSGRYSGSRIKELTRRVYLDTENQTIRAREGSAMLLYASGGSIPDRGYYAMRLAEGGTKIGELDEEFVFERRVGNSFMFGVQAWRIVSIGDEAVTVAPLDRAADCMPFWKAEKAPRGGSVCRRMLEHCARYQRDPVAFSEALATRLGFSSDAADALSTYLASQVRSQSGVPLPSLSSLVVELFQDPSQKADMTTIIVHTLRGAAINEPLGIALAAALSQRLGLRVDRLSDDDSIVLLAPLVNEDDAEAALRDSLFELTEPKALLDRIRGGLAESGTFGAAFRENAGRALLLPKAGFGKRTPLWVTRLRAKKLYDRTVDYPDFPIVAETWKTLLENRFDMPGLMALCDSLADGSTSLASFRPRAPSPFALQAGWAVTNRYLYEGDELSHKAAADSSAGNQAIDDALNNPSLRPHIPVELAKAFGSKLRREIPLWAPETAADLADWVDERILIPVDEWDTLLAACPQELAETARHAVDNPANSDGILARLSRFRLSGATIDVIVRRERQARLVEEVQTAPGRVISGWLASTGPVPLSRLRNLFGLPDEAAVVSALAPYHTVETGDCGVMGGQAGISGAIDRHALESLLRQTRRAARTSVKSMPASNLHAFIASIQGLPDLNYNQDGTIDGVEATRRALNILSGFPAPAGLWETAILPARVPGYRPEFLDELLSTGEFLWFGAGRRTVVFCAVEEFEAFAGNNTSTLIQAGTHPVDAWQIKDASGLSLSELEEAVWAEAWNGAISSRTFEPVRKAAASGFKRVAAAGLHQGEHVNAGQRYEGRRRIPLALSARWKNGAPIPGAWFALTLEDGPAVDRAGELALAATRVRTVIRRYGIICRPLLEQELPKNGWTALFPAIRQMELAGELISGRFFDGIDGLQFMGRDAFQQFKQNLGIERLCSLNACDPASLAGFSIAGLSAASKPVSMPSRLVSNHYCTQEGTIICVSRRSYHELDIALPPDDPQLGSSLTFLMTARRRIVSPERRVVVSKINGEAAADSPYARVLVSMGFEADRGALTLW